MNPHDPKAFADEFQALDTTTDPREIREAFEQDEPHRPAKYPFEIVRGELVRVKKEQSNG